MTTLTTDKYKITLTEGTTKNGLRVFLAEVNAHSEEHRRYTVTLIEDGKQYICGEKGVYKSKAAAKKIYNQVVAAY